jgi:RNA polymerase sigma-70 factor (ECF subfamily)
MPTNTAALSRESWLPAGETGQIELARNGDAEAFGALYERHVDMVRGYVMRRAGSWELAEDLVSETFIRAFTRMTSFTGGNFEAWLTTIARNLLLDHFRLSSTRLELTVDEVREVEREAEMAQGPEDVLIERLTEHESHSSLARVEKAMRLVANDYETCLRLRFLEGQTLAQTAQALGRSQGAVKLLQFRATKAVREDLAYT